MSVINNMLRDLNKRQAPERSPDYINASIDDAQQSMIEPQRPNNLGLLSLAFIVVLLLVAAGGYFFVSDQSSQSQVGVETTDLANPVEKPIETSKEQAKEQGKSVLVLMDKEKLETKTVKQVTIEQRSIKVSKVAPSIAVPTLKQVKAPEKSHKPPQAKKQLEALKPKEKPKTVKVQTTLTPLEQDAKMAGQAVNFFSKGDVSLAYRHLFDFISTHENNQKSRIILASHLLQDQRVAEAGDVILGLRLKGEPQARQVKARWHEAKGDVTLAIETLASALPDIREHTAYYVLLASYYQRFSEPEKAVQTYTTLLEYDDHVANWWAGLAISSDRTQQWDQARFAYQQALRLPELNTKIIPYAQKRLLELNRIMSKADKNKVDQSK